MVTRYAFIIRTAARQQWVYRSELLARSVQIALFVGIFMALWTTAYAVSGQERLAGFSRAEMVWYFAMTETIILSSSRIFLEIAETVRAGDLAYTLSRPVSYPLFQVANSLGNSLPRFFLNMLIASAVVAVGTQQLAGSLPGLLGFLLLAAVALTLDALIGVLIGLAAFWIEEVSPIFWIYSKLLFTVGGMFLPLEFFPKTLRDAAQWLPFQFITYAPARTLVKFDLAFVAHSLAGQLIYLALFIALVALVWWRATRRLVIHGG